MKPFTLLAVIVFALVAALQLLRVVMGWEIVINGVSVPSWASIVACVVAAVLSAMVARENRVRR
jgi:membrane associated rhomboid family serine protease